MSVLTPSPAPDSASTYNGLSSADSMLKLIQLVFILVLILLAAYFVTKYVGRFNMGKLKDSNFKVIDTYRISQNKFIQIVKIANKYVAIAVGKDTITFITELDESEVLIRDANAKQNINFKQILEQMRNKPE